MNRVMTWVWALTFIPGMAVASGQDYTPISNVKEPLPTYADIQDVSLLSTNFSIESVANGTYQKRNLVVSLAITSQASTCESLAGVEVRNAQRSLDSDLNPTDLELALRTTWKDGCISGSYGPKFSSRYDLTFFLNERQTPSVDQPWPGKPDWADKDVVYYTFDVGMMGGINWKTLYKLDYSKLDNVTFTFVKRFAYIQGQVITEDPGN